MYSGSRDSWNASAGILEERTKSTKEEEEQGPDIGSSYCSQSRAVHAAKMRSVRQAKCLPDCVRAQR
jgi:hypothetical protein